MKIILLLFLPMAVLSQSQIFNGKLTYSRTNLPVSTKLDTFYLNNTLVTMKPSNYVEREILIKDSILLEKTSAEDSTLIGVIEQINKKAFLLDILKLKTKIEHTWLATKIHKVLTREKTKEIKYIMGLACRKYIYTLEFSKTIAWIPENSPYKKQRDFEEHFDYYFFPDGLAFEMEEVGVFNSKTYGSVMKLLKLELFNPTKEDFDSFLDEARKQPIDPQYFKF